MSIMIAGSGSLLATTKNPQYDGNVVTDRMPSSLKSSDNPRSVTTAEAGKGALLIISGPSGSGKGTVVKALAATSAEFALSISVTTRKKRAGEEEGVHYFFKTADEFDAMQAGDELLEHASFVGNLYGTPRFYVEDMIKKSKTVLLEIEANGALQVKAKYPDAILIFLMPPSFKELQKRLTDRGTEDTETLRARLVRAGEEINLIDKYDYLVINDILDDAVEDIKKIAHVERLRPFRYSGLDDGFYE